MIGRQPFCQGHLVVEDDLLVGLRQFRQQAHDDLEAGGLLLGFRRQEHLHVADSTVPLKTDSRSRMGFQRSAKGHAQIAQHLWRTSGMTMDYMGEWHTHPERWPSPSTIDLREWRIILRRRTEPMVFIIVGTVGEWFGVGLGDDIERITLRVDQSSPAALANSR